MNTLHQLQSGELKGTKHVKMSCGLSEFPQELFNLSGTLETLDLSSNKLSSLPDDFRVFKHLKILFLSDNQFTEFPEVLGECKKLDIIGFKANQIENMSESSLPYNTRWLILTNNRLKSFPSSIGNCTRMQKLMLAGNQLTSLPIELSKCKNLGLLRISSNKLNSLPEWLLEMPNLAWLAYAGNPFSIKKSILQNEVIELDWKDIALKKKLGEGASGIIWEATINNESIVENTIAVKLFKGAITSDGLPEDEMNIALMAGNHPNLVNVLGSINNHPENKNGLLFSLIPPNYINLGNPPNLISCTRDVFKEGFQLNIYQSLIIAKSIANVGKYLHEKGIMHGDLYAHNILINKDGHPLLGDFGAASFYKKEDTTNARKLERLEIKAFGYLLDDLINYTKYDNPDNKDLIIKLCTLRDKCLNDFVTERPNFVLLLHELDSLHTISE